MSYKFLVTVNFFALQRLCDLLEEHNIIYKIEDSYHFNVTAGWVDPFCNNNERSTFVLDSKFALAKKILEENFK